MKLDRRQTIIVGVAASALTVAALVVLMAHKRAVDARDAPSWTDPGQPPEGVAGPATAAPAVSWAANRATPMSACCTGRGAGRRAMRTYPTTLAESEGSFIRASFEAGL